MKNLNHICWIYQSKLVSRQYVMLWVNRTNENHLILHQVVSDFVRVMNCKGMLMGLQGYGASNSVNPLVKPYPNTVHYAIEKL